MTKERPGAISRRSSSGQQPLLAQLQASLHWQHAIAGQEKESSGAVLIWYNQFGY